MVTCAREPSSEARSEIGYVGAAAAVSATDICIVNVPCRICRGDDRGSSFAQRNPAELMRVRVEFVRVEFVANDCLRARNDVLGRRQGRAGKLS